MNSDDVVDTLQYSGDPGLLGPGSVSCEVIDGSRPESIVPTALIGREDLRAAKVRHCDVAGFQSLEMIAWVERLGRPTRPVRDSS